MSFKNSVGYRAPRMTSQQFPSQTSSQLSQGRSVREFEEQMSSLRMENFNLKLRLYLIKENNPGFQAVNAVDGQHSLLKQLADMKVDNEVLRKELHEKLVLLEDAALAINQMESLQKETDTKNQEIVNELYQRLEYLENRDTPQIDEFINRSNIDGTVNALQKRPELEGHITESVISIAQLKYQIANLEQKLLERDETIKEYEDKITEVVIKNAELLDQLETKENDVQKIERPELEGHVTESVTSIAQLKYQIAKVEEQLLERDETIKEYEDKITEVVIKNAKLLDQLETKENDVQKIERPELEGHVTESVTSIAQLKYQIAKVEEQLLERDETIKEYEDKITEVVIKNAKLLDQLETKENDVQKIERPELEGHVTESVTSIAQLKYQIANLEQKLLERDETIKEYEDKITEVVIKNAELLDQLGTKENDVQKIERPELEGHVTESVTSIAQLKYQIAKLEQKLLKRDETIKEYEDKITEVVIKNAELLDQLETKENDVQKIERPELEGHVTESVISIAQLKYKIAKLEQKLLKRDETIKECEDKITEVVIKNAELLDQLETKENDLQKIECKHRLLSPSNANLKEDNIRLISALMTTQDNFRKETIKMKACEHKVREQRAAMKNMESTLTIKTINTKRLLDRITEYEKMVSKMNFEGNITRRENRFFRSIISKLQQRHNDCVTIEKAEIFQHISTTATTSTATAVIEHVGEQSSISCGIDDDFDSKEDAVFSLRTTKPSVSQQNKPHQNHLKHHRQERQNVPIVQQPPLQSDDNVQYEQGQHQQRQRQHHCYHSGALERDMYGDAFDGCDQHQFHYDEVTARGDYQAGDYSHQPPRSLLRVDHKQSELSFDKDQMIEKLIRNTYPCAICGHFDDSVPVRYTTSNSSLTHSSERTVIGHSERCSSLNPSYSSTSFANESRKHRENFFVKDSSGSFHSAFGNNQ